MKHRSILNIDRCKSARDPRDRVDRSICNSGGTCATGFCNAADGSGTGPCAPDGGDLASGSSAPDWGTCSGSLDPCVGSTSGDCYSGTDMNCAAGLFVRPSLALSDDDCARLVRKMSAKDNHFGDSCHARVI
ncbi:MAG TPA: hypothetical protein VN397_00440 [Candidatus Methylomirabilis sp.]|nr:hypothetical protein [Candidatus Methylomirabilis sp.]